MPSAASNRHTYTLRQVAESLQRAVAKWYDHPYWIRAEMAKLNHYHHSGHCYPELVEKEEGRLVAQMKGNLWRDNYEQINRRFLEVTREPLKDGIAILMHATVRYHPVHGLALDIHDIDPAYTLGELARRKQETIERLKKEDIIDRNRALPMPLLPQRVAVISVETSKGYADFLSRIDGNEWGYRFFHMLFPSLLQGDEAVDKMIFQLERIQKVVHHFDVVAIIRGGGGDVGLSCYDDYRLAKAVALFPIPVLAGIGHSTNETVVQMVAHRNNITPTALADFLIQQFHNLAVPLKDYQRIIAEQGQQKLRDEQLLLGSLSRLFRSAATMSIRDNLGRLERMAAESWIRLAERFRVHHESLRGMQEELLRLPGQRIKEATGELTALERQVRALDPANVLKRGYSITRKEGKAIRFASEVKKGDRLETELWKGMITSTVTSKKQGKNSR